VVEVFDGKGNKVSKQRLSTGDFGVASSTFRLATEVNEGTYRVRATIGDVQTEKAVTVGKYSLPKFNVAMSLDKGFYIIGDTVKGTLNARYFFGKPVAGGAVTVTLFGYDVEFTPFATLTPGPYSMAFYNIPPVDAATLAQLRDADPEQRRAALLTLWPSRDLRDIAFR